MTAGLGGMSLFDSGSYQNSMGSREGDFHNCPLRLSWFLVLRRHQNQALLLAPPTPAGADAQMTRPTAASANHWVAPAGLTPGATSEEGDGAEEAQLRMEALAASRPGRGGSEQLGAGGNAAAAHGLAHGSPGERWGAGCSGGWPRRISSVTNGKKQGWTVLRGWLGQEFKANEDSDGCGPRDARAAPTGDAHTR